MLNSLLLAALGLGAACRAAIIENLDDSCEYDYVVVGSGAGGGPVAARLASYGHSVLIVEAGEDYTKTKMYQEPLMNTQASEYKPMAWEFFVNHYSDLEQQKRDSKMSYRTPSGEMYVGLDPPPDSKPLGIFYPRSGTLGGCTAHNAMFNIYPADADWRYIQELTGDSSWSPKKMRAIYERLERCTYARPGTPGHGFNGWLGTAAFPLNVSMQDKKLEVLGGSMLGHNPWGPGAITHYSKLDINNANKDHDTQSGLFPMVVSNNNGKRAGPVDFINQIFEKEKRGELPRRGRLDILLKTLVTRVVFDNEEYGYGGRGEPRAIGIEYVRGKSLYRADPRASYGEELPPKHKLKVRREVILAGGTFNTPQILKLSGVGPAKELTGHGIPVVVDAPAVGTNMQDRYEQTVVVSAPQKFKGRFIASYLLKSSVAENNAADLIIAPSILNFRGYYPGYSTKTTSNKNRFTWIILKAFSRNNAGTVTLRSNDARDMPIINFNSFDTGVNRHGEGEKDLRALYEGVRWARKVMRNTTYSDGNYFGEAYPGKDVRSTREMKTHIRDTAWGHHASCTCPIGPKGDKRAVLDSGFRVQGVKNLRVVDASVFPKIPGYFIAVPIYMISEKAADQIHHDALEEY